MVVWFIINFYIVIVVKLVSGMFYNNLDIGKIR